MQLPVEAPLTPIYVGKIDAKQAKFPAPYCIDLENILRSDLKMSGLFSKLDNSEECDKLLKTEDPKECFSSTKWDEKRIPHIVKVAVSGDQLNAYVFTTKTRSLLRIKPLTLQGELPTDRRAIHLLSDGIHKLIFAKDGVARSRILFAKQSEGKSEIWVCDWDGGNTRQLTEDHGNAISPVFFPAKQGFEVDKFLYVSYREGVPKIYLAHTKEKACKPIVALRGNQLLPAVSRDRSKLAFISDAGGRADLFVQKIDVERSLMSKPIQAYSFPNSVQASPSFSPDGKKIAFVSDKDGSPRIFVIDTPISMRGNKLPIANCLTRINRENTGPSWSPDGRKIAYSAKTGGTRQIWIYDFDRLEEVQLTQGEGHKESPSWAPDSLHLVYNCCVKEDSELYVIDLHQKESKQITGGAGNKFYPAWEPLEMKSYD